MPKKQHDKTRETEKFISLVQERPYLFDPRDPRHKDAVLVDNAWISISKEMGIDDGGFQIWITADAWWYALT